jgi:hypothetical protein
VSFSFGGQRQTQSNTSSVDQNTQQQLAEMWKAYQASGQAGPSPLLNGAAGYNTGAMDAGRTGMGFLTGDPNARAALMNPYQQQVIDANNAQWKQTNAQTSNQINDEATKANAFGGSRHGVAEGVALGQNNMAQQAQTAGLLQGGFANAQNTAQNLAQMGYNAAGQNANLGFGGVGSPAQWYAQQLRNGFVMPSGQSSSGSGTSFGGQTGFKLPFLG